MLSDIFVPIIPAIVAGGLLMGINNLLTSNLIHGQSIISLYPQWEGLATAINLFASAPFTFLPVLIGFSATKKFGGNPYLGAAMGMIMVHPELLNAYNIGIADAPIWNIFGFHIQAIGYQGTVLPVLAVAFILATLEKTFHKVTSSWLDNCHFLFDIYLCWPCIKRSWQLISLWNHLGLSYIRICWWWSFWTYLCSYHINRYASQLHCY